GRFTPGQEIVVPLKNQDGQYVADQRTLDELEAEHRVAFRYTGGNPNGSRNDIAGITNARGNVVGLMPHPEHAVEPGFGADLSGAGTVGMREGTDGLDVFLSVLEHLTR
ncbi:MAG: phosphoribosylformylglycinamidine synthase subunit PurQ, partial [Micrococcaceae bacterium]|nr:phosphoribosylformylglycinamidine synthase subunit PurQ [Micrococcaceae bacterium]